MKKELHSRLAICFPLFLLVFACKMGNSQQEKGADEKPPFSVDKYVVSKYSEGPALAQKKQRLWNAVNCHDPKLFQDDNGTYYVYSTDASVGNAGKVGLIVRSSKDLVNWSVETSSALQGFWDEDMLSWCNMRAGEGENILHNNSAYTATTWAPTVIKQNGLYYMFHGINTDLAKDSGETHTSYITMAVAGCPEGPFYPVHYVSKYKDGDSADAKINSEILKIKSCFQKLGVTYGQSGIIRFATKGKDSRIDTENTGFYDTDTMTKTASNSWGNGFGCIDPEFVYDVADGSLKEFKIGSNDCYAMIFGSWKGGIGLFYVDSVSLKPVYAPKTSKAGLEIDFPMDKMPEGKTADETYGLKNFVHKLVGGKGAGYEGAQLIFNSDTGKYYCFVSMGDLSYEYRIGVAASDIIDGDYKSPRDISVNFTDTGSAAKYHARSGKIAGGNEINGEYSWRCPGGQSILRTADGKIIMAYHTRTNFQHGYYFYLQCHQMFFEKNGWPVINQNEYYFNIDGKTESLQKLSMNDIVGSYDTIITTLSTSTSNATIYPDEISKAKYNTNDATPTPSMRMVIKQDGTISGDYTGSFILSDDGYSVTINLCDVSGNSLGSFTGYALKTIDWARKGDVNRKTVTFTTLCVAKNGKSKKAGEYFWGNLRNF